MREDDIKLVDAGEGDAHPETGAHVTLKLLGERRDHPAHLCGIIPMFDPQRTAGTVGECRTRSERQACN